MYRSFILGIPKIITSNDNIYYIPLFHSDNVISFLFFKGAKSNVKRYFYRNRYISYMLYLILKYSNTNFIKGAKWMNFKQLLIDNFTYKTSYIARQAQGMNVKETKDYIAVDCGLPADTFNIITLLNNNVTEGIEKLYKEVNNYNQKKFPMSVWFWDDRYEQTIKSELIKLDLKEAEQNIAMVAELNTIHPTINMPEGFTIQKHLHQNKLKVWRNVS